MSRGGSRSGPRMARDAKPCTLDQHWIAAGSTRSGRQRADLGEVAQRIGEQLERSAAAVPGTLQQPGVLHPHQPVQPDLESAGWSSAKTR